MSTDPGRASADPERPRAQRRAARRFARTLAATIAALAVAAALLGVAGTLRGPRVESVEFDPAGAVSRAGQRLVLHANQQLAPVAARQLVVRPAADATVTSTEAAITITFTGILRYDARYTVQVRDVRGAFGGASSTLEYDVRTPGVDLYVLHRDDRVAPDGTKEPDTIRRASLTGTEAGAVVFGAPRIQEYVALPTALAVVTIAADGTDALSLAPLDGGAPQELLLPSHAHVDMIAASPANDLLGFALTGDATTSSPAVDNALYVYDLALGTGVPRPVAGLDGAPLQVMDWEFVPGTSSLVAQAYDQSLFLTDVLASGPLTPLGAHAELDGFVPGTTRAIVTDPAGQSTIDLSSGAVAPLRLAAPPERGIVYPGKLVVLGAAGDYVQELVRTTDDRTFVPYLVRSSGGRTRTLYEPPTSGTRIQDYCVSPNGQYAAVETVPDTARPDGYPGAASFSPVTTNLVDLDTGLVRRSFDGFQLSWCR